MNRCAVLSFRIDSRPAGAPPGEMLLLPPGEFRARDGRPADVAAWRLDAGIAAACVARGNARKTPFLIDYEHQSLRCEQNGQPAPAAGWFAGLRWVEAAGLFTVGLSWTERARRMLDAREYRFQSPVFAYDKTGAVLEIISAALTNTPALDGLPDAAALAAARYASPLAAPPALTEVERSVCRQLGVTETAFVAARAQIDREAAIFNGTAPAGSALTEAEQVICRQLGLSEAAFLATKHGA